MNDTPIFDELHRELDAPTMKFVEPDGSLMCYGVKIFVSSAPHNYQLVMQGRPPLMNFPVLPAPWNANADWPDECTCPRWGNPSWPHRHCCPVAASEVVNDGC